MKFLKSLSILILISSAAVYGIVAPSEPGKALTGPGLDILEENPGYFMPGDGYTRQIAEFKKAKREGAKPTPVYAYVPVLLCQYSDLDQPEWPAINMANQLFDEAATWATGSMRKYYDEVSYGQFELDGEIVSGEWVKVDEPSTYYNTEVDFGRDGEMAQTLIRNAVSKIDDTVDFSKFDLDGDGRVDYLIVVHSGPGGESGGPEIWSHSSAFWGNPLQTNDQLEDGTPVVIYGYVVQPAVTTTRQMEGIEVYAHEFGHALGLPDLYDRDGSSEGVGEWDLMSANTAHDEAPAHFNAWSKEVLGWIDPIVIEGNVYDLEIPPVEKSGTVYKIWTKGEIASYTFNWGPTSADVGREYFLIENRQKLMFDRELPGSGLLIWHVRNDVSSQNDNEAFKLCDLEEADGRDDLDNGRNNGDEGDPFPGTAGNIYFNRMSLPSSAGFYGDPSSVAVENISVKDTLITADLFSFAPDLEFIESVVHDGTGDDNGFADPGETVDVHAVFRNWGPGFSQLTMTISTEDTAVTILDSTVTISSIAEESVIDDASDMFRISISEGAAYHPINTVVTVTDGDLYTAEFNVTVMMENLKILVVDASGEKNDKGYYYINYYERALLETNIPYFDIWSVRDSGTPTSETLDLYRTIVWITGSQIYTLTGSQQSLIENFVNDGGSLLLLGQNIGEDLVEKGSLEDSTFYADVLKARYLMPDPGLVNILATGIERDPISNDYVPYFFLNGGSSESNQLDNDVIGPLNGSVPVINYFGTGLMGLQAGVRYSGEGGKRVYLTFGIEGINEIGTNNITRHDLMGNIIRWLQQPDAVEPVSVDEPAVAESFRLGQNYPNPFNGGTRIPFTLDRMTDLTFTVYDISGRAVYTQSYTSQPIGSHEIEWSGKDLSGRDLPSGIYVYSLQTGGMRNSGKMILMK